MLEVREIHQQGFGIDVKITALQYGEADPQRQLEEAIDVLIHGQAQDDGHSLLIVYYSGHGMTLVAQPYELIIGATYNGDFKKDEGGAKVHKPSANFSQAAHILRANSSSDVLVILDCCYAGNFLTDLSRNQGNRCFEVMMATGGNGTTPSPGPRSYTTVLIESLRELREGDARVTTWDLAQTIMKKQGRKGKSNLHPVCLGNGERHIVLDRPVRRVKGAEEMD